MNEILAGQVGVLCHMDDVLIFGRDQSEYDSRLHSVLQQVQAAGVTLNPEKCEFSEQCLTFLGHSINKHGIALDPSKTTADLEMETPRSITELRRFMGMVIQLGKFTPKLQSSHNPCVSFSAARGYGCGDPPKMQPSKGPRPSWRDPLH